MNRLFPFMLQNMEKYAHYPCYLPVSGEFSCYQGPSQAGSASPDGGPDQMPPSSTSNEVKPACQMTAASLVESALARGFTPFQIAILLMKNAFEGYQLMAPPSEDGTDGFQYHAFVSEFASSPEYRTGVVHGLDLLCQAIPSHEAPFDPDSVIALILEEHLILFPAGYFPDPALSSVSPLTLPDKYPASLMTLPALEAFVMDHLEVMDAVNRKYELLFNEELEPIRVALDSLAHFEQKWMLACDPSLNIQTGEELNQVMYDFLVDYKLHTHDGDLPFLEIHKDSEPPWARKYRSFIKSLYRQCARNCHELFAAPDTRDSGIQPLEELYLDMNTHYRESLTIPDKLMLHYAHLMNDLSKILTFRIRNGLVLVPDHSFFKEKRGRCHLISDREWKVMERLVRDQVSEMALSSRFENKLFIISDPEMVVIHRQYLRIQHQSIEKEILRVGELISAQLRRNKENDPAD